MGFCRQLDLLMTVLATLLVFASCTFLGGLRVRISFAYSSGRFLGWPSVWAAHNRGPKRGC